jgi:acetyl esterase/lipase
VGDSAGGHLAFATALELKRLGRAQPAGIVGLSPWVDFDHTAKLTHPNVVRDVAIPAARLAPVARLCVGSEDVHPDRSPVNAELAGLPPVFMHCAADEVLRHDAELMAARLDAAGVPCTLNIWAGMVHAFPILGDVLKESRLALDELAGFVDRVTAAEPVRPLAVRLERARPDAVPAAVAPLGALDPFPPLPPERSAVAGRRALPSQRARPEMACSGDFVRK